MKYIKSFNESLDLNDIDRNFNDMKYTDIRVSIRNFLNEINIQHRGLWLEEPNNYSFVIPRSNGVGVMIIFIDKIDAVISEVKAVVIKDENDYNSKRYKHTDIHNLKGMIDYISEKDPILITKKAFRKINESKEYKMFVNVDKTIEDIEEFLNNFGLKYTKRNNNITNVKTFNRSITIDIPKFNSRILILEKIHQMSGGRIGSFSALVKFTKFSTGSDIGRMKYVKNLKELGEIIIKLKPEMLTMKALKRINKP